MKKMMKICIILLLIVNFMPFSQAEAASTYNGGDVANQTGNKVVGQYSSYSAALKVMNSQNSTASSVRLFIKMVFLLIASMQFLNLNLDQLIIIYFLVRLIRLIRQYMDHMELMRQF